MHLSSPPQRRWHLLLVATLTICFCFWKWGRKLVIRKYNSHREKKGRGELLAKDPVAGGAPTASVNMLKHKHNSHSPMWRSRDTGMSRFRGGNAGGRLQRGAGEAPVVVLTCAGNGCSLVLLSSGWFASPTGRYAFWPDPVSYMDMGLLPRADGRRFKEEWLEVSGYSEPVCTWYILVEACFLRFEFSLCSVWSWKKCLAVGLCFSTASRKSKHQINAYNYQL